MTYEEALKLLRDDTVRLVRRPHWNLLKSVAWHDEPTQYILDNYDGMCSGVFGPFRPSADDLTATDWAVYVPLTDEEVERYEADDNNPSVLDFPPNFD